MDRFSRVNHYVFEHVIIIIPLHICSPYCLLQDEGLIGILVLPFIPTDGALSGAHGPGHLGHLRLRRRLRWPMQWLRRVRVVNLELIRHVDEDGVHGGAGGSVQVAARDTLGEVGPEGLAFAREHHVRREGLSKLRREALELQLPRAETGEAHVPAAGNTTTSLKQKFSDRQIFFPAQ